MLETICDIMVDAYKRNWITSRDGNVSYVTTTVITFTLHPVVCVSKLYNLISLKRSASTELFIADTDQRPSITTWRDLPYTDISANLKPSGEIPLHFGLQKEMGQHKDEVRVVVHVHPTYCIAAMHAGIDLSTISNAFPELNRYTKVAPNVGDVPPISQELADQCHKNLQLDRDGNIAYDIVGIKGHGVVAIDTSPWRAYEHIERLEHICKIVLASGNY
jgi:ribulose-5-phosphate 4-epimerase/fuculose-1-phosphate aldolase